jgi:manganese/iron transport system permease protein
LVASGLFLLALLFSPSHGILTQPRSPSSQSQLWREIKGLFRGGKV